MLSTKEAAVWSLLGSVAQQIKVLEEASRFEEGYYIKYLPAWPIFYLLGGDYTPRLISRSTHARESTLQGPTVRRRKKGQ